MKTIEEKAKEYLMNFPATGTFSIEEMIVNAFVAGASGERPKWKCGSDIDDLEDGAKCVIIDPYDPRDIRVCSWKKKEECWYNTDGRWDSSFAEVLYYLEMPRCDYFTGKQG